MLIQWILMQIEYYVSMYLPEGTCLWDTYRNHQNLKSFTFERPPTAVECVYICICICIEKIFIYT